MGLKDRGREILREAEAALRKLTAEAAEEGDYDELRLLADCARRAGELGRSLAVRPEIEVDRALREPRHRSSAPRSDSQYPRFSRSGDTLVKTSWSKKNRDEYEHKAPYSTLSWMIGALSAADAEHRPVPMDRLLPVRGEDGQEIPSYQAYLALAFLRTREIVTPVGRSGYKLAVPAREAELAAEREWQALEAYA